jgi:GNAT superfamily N-acetyltransferase
MSVSPSIRRAEPRDRGALLALTPRLADFPTPAWRTPQEIAVADHDILAAALDSASTGADAVVLVAGEPEGPVDGFVFVSSRTDYFTHERHAHVEVLAVAPHAQGQGVARALMTAAEAWASARGDRVITLNVFDANRRARSVYARLGYLPETIHYRKSLIPDVAPAAPPREAPAAPTIRPDTPADADALWPILQAVIAEGETYAFPPDMGRAEALALWHPPGGHTFVAELDGRIAGTSLLKANQPGLGSHVANCGYMVAPGARGRGVGEALCRHSLDAARALGFLAMQFNSVVSTNRGAIALWQRCGFSIVGTVPLAFRHPTDGLVDIHVMHRLL